MITISLKGSTFYVAGSFTGRLKSMVEQHIKDGGGTLSEHINSSVTALIAGHSCHNSINKALSREIPILSQQQLDILLRDGTIDHEPSKPIDAELDIAEVIAELRSLFDGPPSSDTWSSLLMLLEQCNTEQQEALVHYITPFVARWDDMDRPTWAPLPDHPLMTGGHKTLWVQGLPEQALRVAPPLWLTEMLRGVYHPKHALARVINVHQMRTNGSRLIKLLQNPYLTKMTTLVLGMKNSYSKSFFEVLRDHDNVRSLTHLYLDAISHTTREQFLSVMSRKNHALTSLEHVYFRSDFAGANVRHVVTPRITPTDIEALPPLAHATVYRGNWYQGQWTRYEDCFIP